MTKVFENKNKTAETVTPCDDENSACPKTEQPFDKDNPVHNFANRDKLSRLADFVFEAGMLRKTPRSGYQFLGSGKENVAEHSFRTAIIGYILGQMAGCSPEHVAMLCLFHDFHEARIGDFNYVNSMYNTAKSRLAMEHATMNTGLEEKILPLWDEQENRQTQEAKLARDADQLDLIANLVQERDLGNAYAAKWLKAALQRLQTPEGLKLAQSLESGDHTDWWFKGAKEDWWINKR